MLSRKLDEIPSRAGRESPNADAYTTKWLYTLRSFDGKTADTLHAGCDIDLHYYTLRNVTLENVSIGNTMGWSGTIPIVTEVRDLGGGEIGWTSSTIEVENGIIVAAPR